MSWHHLIVIKISSTSRSFVNKSSESVKDSFIRASPIATIIYKSCVPLLDSPAYNAILDAFDPSLFHHYNISH